MAFIEAGINRIEDLEIKTELQERLEIVQHKIKFMDKISVACLDTENRPNILLKSILEDAGAILKEDPAQAQVLIYQELGTGLLELMGMVPSLLDAEWPAVKYSRVYLMNDPVEGIANAETAVAVLEDVAEMLYPGNFVFGNEGWTWSGFGM